MQADAGVSSATVARGSAVAALRSRVAQHVGGWLTDVMCVQVAIAATLRTPIELLEFLLKPSDAKRALAARETIALKSDEFRCLFGTGASPTRMRHINDATEDHIFKEHAKRTSDAMRCSLGEANQSKIWASAWSKVIMVVAMHMNDYDARLTDVLGTVVKGDARRIEDVANMIDDEGVSTMMLSQAVGALAHSVT